MTIRCWSGNMRGRGTFLILNVRGLEEVKIGIKNKANAFDEIDRPIYKTNRPEEIFLNWFFRRRHGLWWETNRNPDITWFIYTITKFLMLKIFQIFLKTTPQNKVSTRIKSRIKSWDWSQTSEQMSVESNSWSFSWSIAFSKKKVFWLPNIAILKRRFQNQP